MGFKQKIEDTAKYQSEEFGYFSHEELQNIRNRAFNHATHFAPDPIWEQTFKDLAIAADRLDALKARSGQMKAGSDWDA
jgi:hypothetical protein